VHMSRGCSKTPAEQAYRCTAARPSREPSEEDRHTYLSGALVEEGTAHMPFWTPPKKIDTRIRRGPSSKRARHTCKSGTPRRRSTLVCGSPRRRGHCVHAHALRSPDPHQVRPVSTPITQSRAVRVDMCGMWHSHERMLRSRRRSRKHRRRNPDADALHACLSMSCP
jgi:hypothetical protein